MNNKCLKDWSSFLKEVAIMFEKGKNELEISNIFCGSEVEWEGRILDIKLDEQYAPGIALEMKPTNVLMRGGKVLRADYQFLQIEEHPSNWSNCRVGDVIRFKAKLIDSQGPFPGIEFSTDDTDPEVVLMLALHECELISIKH